MSLTLFNRHQLVYSATEAFYAETNQPQLCAGPAKLNSKYNFFLLPFSTTPNQAMNFDQFLLFFSPFFLLGLHFLCFRAVLPLFAVPAFSNLFGHITFRSAE